MDYSDDKIECGDEALRVRAYYFPWGSKRIPYGSIRAVRRVEIDALSGRGRIWGTANPRYWFNLDPTRPRKRVGFVLDLGRRVQPVLSPDDPDAFEAALAVARGTDAEGVGSG